MSTSLRCTIPVWASVGLLFGASAAFAEDEAATPVVPAVTDPPGPALPLSFDEYRLEEMRRRARVSRNALIGTSVTAAVGAALFSPGVVTQCGRVDRFDGTDEIVCSTAGAFLVGFGTPLLFGGGVGMVATGIVLGVRKGKIRKLKTRLGAPTARKVRWNPKTATFVF